MRVADEGHARADSADGTDGTDADEARAFEVGMAAGLDPQEETGRTGESAVTHISSPWNHRLCTTCRHSFRRGDPVHLGDDVAHLDPALECAGSTSADPTSTSAAAPTGSSESAAFAAGVLATWPPVDGVPVVPLGTGDWQVADPVVHGARPPRCLYCAHTFRTGEHVVLCPCAPDRPVCGAAVHRDPAAGLVCWESWRPEGRLAVCPVKLVAVQE
ncbi:hypothetical protein ACH4SP_28260 [Streptomyces sp. NPDC021093]|uniref:hypothetical protein n=1 Tax=Streptomyces sp. NPDC021093 TaxID=3365112 RepID=UPI00379B1C3F